MWFFESPRIIFGKEAIEQLENPLHVVGSKALIVTDKDLIELGMIDIVTKHLKNGGIEYKIFDGVLPDPPVSVVKKGAEICKEYQPDLIIAFGGGSSIDTGKAIWILYEDPEFDITGLNPFVSLPTGTKAKLIAIPTTSGTGAETTSAVVLSDDEEGLKLELLNRHAIPTLAIVDPIFVEKMPKKLVASTAFDAIGHCIEGITGKWTNIYTEGLANVAMKMIFDNLEKSYLLADPDAREAMHNAATIAGLSFGNAMAQFGHSIAHTLGAVFHIPHGFAVGLTVPYLIQFLVNNDEKSVKVLSNLARSTGVANWSDGDKKAIDNLLEKIIDLQKITNFPRTLKELDISREKLDANMEKFKDLILQTGTITICPVTVDNEIAGKMVSYMFEGKDIDF